MRPLLLRVRTGHPVPAGAGNVITSYSIHYTKLYEGWFGFGLLLRHRLVGRFALSAQQVGRITSYNVCYTKLLRLFYAADPSMFDVMMIPKVLGPEDITYVDRLLAQLEARHQIAKPIT